MDNYQEAQILEVSRQFQIYGDLLHAEPCKIGHINETYIAAYNQGGVHVRYEPVPQRLAEHGDHLGVTRRGGRDLRRHVDDG